MNTFERYLFRELLSVFIAIFIVLELIVTSAIASRLLEQVTAGAYPANAVGFLIAYAGFDSLPIVLPFAGFLAVLLTFGRYYRDNEACAAFAVGIGYFSLCKTILRFAVPLAIFLLFFMLETLPSMKERYEINKLTASAGMDIGIVTAGKFIHLGDDIVLFVEENELEKNEIRNIFIAQDRVDGRVIETAKLGRQTVDSAGQRRLYLSQGYRYQGIPGETNFQITNFAEHWVTLPDVSVLQKLSNPKFHRTMELLISDDLADRAELQRRIVMPLSLIILPLAAFVLIRPSRHRGIRRDRYAKMGVSIVFLLLYLNGMIALTKLVANSSVFVYLVWFVQVAVIISIVLSLSNFSLRSSRT